MATVKMLTHMMGTDCERKVGHDYEVDDAEAGRLVKAGFAKLVDEGDGEDEPAPKKEKKSAEAASQTEPKPKKGRKAKQPNETAEQTGAGAQEPAAE